MADPVASALLDYALNQVRIDTFICTLQKHEHGYTLPGRIIDDYNLIFVRRGRADWIIDGHTFSMRPGSLALVPPFVRHHARSQTQRVTIGSVHVRATLPNGTDLFAWLGSPRLRHVKPGTRLDRYLDAVVDEWSRPDLRETYRTMSAWGKLLTLELFLHDASAGLLSDRPLDPLVAAILDELQQRIDRPTTLGELADWAGYSPQYLNRSFTRVFGTTPLKYLTHLKLRRAADLLREQRWTIAAIARQVGIHDEYYFSRLFRQHWGKSPSQYRQQASSDSPARRSIAPLPPNPADR